MRNQTIAVIQARVDSERFPGKVMQPLPADGNIPMIRHIVDSARSIPEIDLVVVATTEDISDNVLAEYCEKESLPFTRGFVNDVLSRYITAAEVYEAGTVIRLTGDNPFLDTDALRACVRYHIAEGNDYTKTEGLPVGLNCEVVSAKALMVLKGEEKNLSREEKEHVTLKLVREKRFAKSVMKVEIPKKIAGIRLTVDYASDYMLMNVLFQLKKSSEKKGIEFIEEVYREKPWLFSVNKENYQKKQYKNLAEEKKAAMELLKRFEMNRVFTILKRPDEKR